MWLAFWGGAKAQLTNENTSVGRWDNQEVNLKTTVTRSFVLMSDCGETAESVEEMWD